MCFVCALCVLLLLFPERATIKQHFVETLDQYFGNVCELDLIFNFDRAYNILDECIVCPAGTSCTVAPAKSNP